MPRLCALNWSTPTALFKQRGQLVAGGPAVLELLAEFGRMSAEPQVPVLDSPAKAAALALLQPLAHQLVAEEPEARPKLGAQLVPTQQPQQLPQLEQRQPLEQELLALQQLPELALAGKQQNLAQSPLLEVWPPQAQQAQPEKPEQPSPWERRMGKELASLLVRLAYWERLALLVQRQQRAQHAALVVPEQQPQQPERLRQQALQQPLQLVRREQLVQRLRLVQSVQPAQWEQPELGATWQPWVLPEGLPMEPELPATMRLQGPEGL